jgi:23S rRNA pseudouridine2605 synthase
MPAERLQKLLSQAGVASRRGAETLIREGRVTINSVIAELGSSADLAIDEVAVDGQPVLGLETPRYLAIYKPRGVLSSAHDERGRRSVVSLVDTDSSTHLWPAGRLDADSEGLMVLTNDGEWANRMLHPRYGMEREYAVLLDDMPVRSEIEAMLAGVELEDGAARLLSARLVGPPREVERDPAQRGTWVRVRVGEGRKREVRRIFFATGLHVRRLVRTRLGPLDLRGLRVGEWRPLRSDEIAALVGERA